MAMPRDNSSCIEGLAARKSEENSINKAFSSLVIEWSFSEILVNL